METNLVEEFRAGLKGINDGISHICKSRTEDAEKIKTINDALVKGEKSLEELRADIDKLRKSQLVTQGQRHLGRAQVVSEDCARFLGALIVSNGFLQGKLDARRGEKDVDRLVSLADEILQQYVPGYKTKAALTTTDIPMPTVFMGQIVELVYKYGQFRNYATIFPMTAPTVKLPQLKSGEPAFGFLAISASVTEKSPQINFITFTANKAGGIIRIPSEIDEDSIVPLGQFVARYIAREMAKWEDTVGYLADGSGTYNSIRGIGNYAVNNTGGASVAPLLQVGTGNTHPTDLTLANFRNLRSLINAAALFESAYYMHPTMESLLVSFNTSATVTPYITGTNGREATLDGFPIRWVGVMPIKDTAAHVNQVQALFGAHSYWYFGERRQLDVQTSREVYFATDEIGIRALERFDVEAMAIDAMAALQLAAS